MAVLQKDTGLEIYRCYERTKQTEIKYEMTRAKMSTVMNKGVDIHCEAVTTQVFRVLLVELGTSIEKSKGSLGAYPSIRQPSVTVTSNSPVVYFFLLSSFFFSITLQSHL